MFCWNLFVLQILDFMINEDRKERKMWKIYKKNIVDDTERGNNVTINIIKKEILSLKNEKRYIIIRIQRLFNIALNVPL